ncbi:MAG: UvrD-helicase domain-containing protein [Gammaproteobacteria bacterium]
MTQGMNQDAAYHVDGQRVLRQRFYQVACDPQRSVAVEACAGAGKTWMLVSRILRALLEGTEPQDILAITFTRKAAAEMRERLATWVAELAQASDAQREQELQSRGMSPEQARQHASALVTLHARLLACGRPVQIRTFHSWFASLLRMTPLSVLQELKLPPEHELLEDDEQATALAWPLFQAAVVRDEPLRQDYLESVARFGRSQTDKALRNALSKRVEFSLADEAGLLETSVEPFAALYPEWSDLPSPLHALLASPVRERWLRRAQAMGAEKNKTPQDAARAIVDAFGLPDEPGTLPQRLDALKQAFFVATEDRLKQHLTRYEAALDAEAELQRLLAAHRQHDAWQHQQRMTRLTRALLGSYAALKRERGWVDMSDVEQAARRLLGDAELSGWMQQRLDARVRHLLVDEFQDTNPLQWQALYGWLSAYAGAGSGEGPRVFLVGDPKQSIYRFRRAEPQVFRAAQAFVVQGLGGALLSCDHTRRCATGVVETLNAVMSGACQDAGYAGFRTHTTESREKGEVLSLPRLERQQVNGRDEAGQGAQGAQRDPVWRDSLSVPRVVPEDSMATLEARQAARWMELELAEGRLRPADLMVLSRRRDRLGRVHEALTALGVPADEPEKADLADSPAVQDVVALLDALVSPRHNLSLARALRSPIFGLDESWLTRIASASREQTSGHPADAPAWWDVIAKMAADPAAQTPLRAVATRLALYREWVGNRPPHDALVAIYQDSDLMARYAATAPAHRRDAMLASLRALLGQALAQDGGRYLSMYRLVRALKAGGIRLGATARPEAVRLLTIHGAKGLEAHTVLMLDADAPPSRPDTMGVLVDWPGESPQPRRFIFLASEKQPPACAAAALAQEQQARSLEELNALYVALTRAASRLVISSSEPHQRGAVASWYERLKPFLKPAAERAENAGQAGSSSLLTHLAPQVLYLRALRTPTAPTEPARAAPEQVPATRDTGGDSVGDGHTRLGLALHRLLQWAPTPLSGWTPSAHHVQAVCKEFGLDPVQGRQAASMAESIIGGPARWAWDDTEVDSWGNEVEIWLDGALMRIDRLVRHRDSGHWWVLDYKSAVAPQTQDVLREQLRGYHRALALERPAETIRLAFINAQGQLIEIANEP